MTYYTGMASLCILCTAASQLPGCSSLGTNMADAVDNFILSASHRICVATYAVPPRSGSLSRLTHNRRVRSAVAVVVSALETAEKKITKVLTKRHPMFGMFPQLLAGFNPAPESGTRRRKKSSASKAVSAPEPPIEIIAQEALSLGDL